MKRSLFLVVCLCLLLMPLNSGAPALANTQAGSAQALEVPSENEAVAPDLPGGATMEAPIENPAITMAENALPSLQGEVAGSMLNASGYSWQELPSGYTPSARTVEAMVYDSTRGKVILFGGECGSSFANDTWSYDPMANTWNNLNPANPPGTRRSQAMVYDSTRGKVILFGGYDGTWLNETWSYDPVANTWTNLNPANSPSGRGGLGMIYDSARGKVILFGGADNGYVNETWSYDPLANAWNNLNPSNPPAARCDHAMVYDAARGKVIMFGGSSGGGGETHNTWSYDPLANAWTDLNPSNQPPNRFFTLWFMTPPGGR